MANRIDNAELTRALLMWTATANDATAPTGTTAGYGGRVRSQYTIANVEKAAWDFQIIKRMDWNYAIARLTVGQAAGGSDTAQNNYFDFTSNGNMYSQGRVRLGAALGGGWSQTIQSDYPGVYLETTADNPGQSAIAAVSWAYQHSGGYNIRSAWGNVGNGTVSWANSTFSQFGDAGAKTRHWLYNPTNGDFSSSAGGDGGWSGNYIYTKQSNSDRALKHNIEYDDGLASYENIKKLKPCTFIYNNDTLERVRRGIIAQDALRDIDREYVKLVPAAPEFDEDGERCDKDDMLALDNNVIGIDTALALHHAIGKIEMLATQVAQLQAEIQVLKA